MSDASVTIRRAVLRDVEALVPLFDSYRQFYGQSSNPELARKFLTERLERGESTVFIAEDGRRAVGFAQSLEFARAVGAVRVTLSTSVTNAPAQALYERTGWEKDTDYYVYVHRL
jgi:hypothetical protein